MPLLEQILPFIYGITIKQLKTTLRKEQCDMKILVSSSTTGTKKITCFGMFYYYFMMILNKFFTHPLVFLQNAKYYFIGPDEFMIPNQVEITSDDFKFSDLLAEGVEFYRLKAANNKSFYLKDTRLNKLLNPAELVRDHYPFRKGSIPQVGCPFILIAKIAVFTHNDFCSP